MKDIEINMLTFVDDGAMAFGLRDDLIKGCKIMCEVMAKWGLTAHVGYDDKSLN